MVLTFAVFLDEAFLAAAIDEEHGVARANANATITRRFLVTALRYDLYLQQQQQQQQ